MGKKKIFINGNYSVEDWIRLVVDKEDFKAYQKGFSTAKGGSKCPPAELIPDGVCYYCKEACQDICRDMVKEYKKHYTVRNKKYLKEDLEG